MDFQALAVDDDAFDHEAQDRLLGVEVGGEQSGFQRFDDLHGGGCTGPCDLGLQLHGLEFGQGLLGAEAMLFDGFDSGTEDVEGEGTQQVGIRQAFPLPGHLQQAGFGLAQTWIPLRNRGDSLQPSSELLPQSVGVEEKVAHGSPDDLICAFHAQGLVAAASGSRVQRWGLPVGA